MDKYLYFKINIIDLTDEIVKASSTFNLYSVKKSIDNSQVIMKFMPNNIPVDLYVKGYTPVDVDVIRSEIEQGLWID